MSKLEMDEFGANMIGLNQEIHDLFSIIDDTWSDYGWGSIVASKTKKAESLKENKDFLNVCDMAINLKTSNISNEVQDEIAHDLQVRLGPLYQVVSKHWDNPTNNHIQVKTDTATHHNKASIWYQSLKAKGETKNELGRY